MRRLRRSTGDDRRAGEPLKRWSAVLLAATVALPALACGDETDNPVGPSAMVASVTIAYVAPTQPQLPPSVEACVRGVGATHVHPSWRGFAAVTMRVVGSERFELTLDDAPIGSRLSIRVSDANACLENATGAATRDVFANGVRLTEIVTTPGSGPEPGLAFTVTADGRVTP